MNRYVYSTTTPAPARPEEHVLPFHFPCPTAVALGSEVLPFARRPSPAAPLPRAPAPPPPKVPLADSFNLLVSTTGGSKAPLLPSYLHPAVNSPALVDRAPSRPAPPHPVTPRPAPPRPAPPRPRAPPACASCQEWLDPAGRGRWRGLSKRGSG